MCLCHGFLFLWVEFFFLEFTGCKHGNRFRALHKPYTIRWCANKHTRARPSFTSYIYSSIQTERKNPLKNPQKESAESRKNPQNDSAKSRADGTYSLCMMNNTCMRVRASACVHEMERNVRSNQIQSVQVLLFNFFNMQVLTGQVKVALRHSVCTPTPASADSSLADA